MLMQAHSSSVLTIELSKNSEATIKYYQYRLFIDNPPDSLEELQCARMHLRKAQALVFK
jgi:hypothetical protein